MGNKDFNAFMDGYIDNIRTNEPKSPTRGSSNKKKKEGDEKVPSEVNADSVYIIKKPKTWWMNFLEKVTGTDEEDFEERKKEEKKESVESEQQFEQELDEIKHEGERKGFFARIFGFFQNDVNEVYEDLDDEQKAEEMPYVSETHSESMVDDEIVEKSSLWSKICGFFGIGAVENYDEDAESINDGSAKPQEDKSMEKMIEMKEDMKDLAVIATATFKKLPKEQFKMFKESADFKRFKEILGKHNLIKVKEKS